MVPATREAHLIGGNRDPEQSSLITQNSHCFIVFLIFCMLFSHWKVYFSESKILKKAFMKLISCFFLLLFLTSKAKYNKFEKTIKLNLSVDETWSESYLFLKKIFPVVRAYFYNFSKRNERVLWTFLKSYLLSSLQRSN